MATRDELLKDIKAAIMRCHMTPGMEGLDHQADAIVEMLDAKYFSVAAMDGPDMGMDMNQVLLPRALTAENGAKGLLIGEFHEKCKVRCPECEPEEEIEECELCHGEGEWTEQVPVSWTTIKDIYQMIVEHFDARRGTHAVPDMQDPANLAGGEGD